MLSTGFVADAVKGKWMLQSIPVRKAAISADKPEGQAETVVAWTKGSSVAVVKAVAKAGAVAMVSLLQ